MVPSSGRTGETSRLFRDQKDKPNGANNGAQRLPPGGSIRNNRRNLSEGLGLVRFSVRLGLGLMLASGRVWSGDKSWVSVRGRVRFIHFSKLIWKICRQLCQGQGYVYLRMAHTPVFRNATQH